MQTHSWEQRKLGELVDVNSGKDYKHLDSGDIPVYGTGGYMTSVCEALSHSEDAIGIGRKGTIDSPYILRAPFWTVDTLFYSIPSKGADLDFAFCLFLKIDWKKKDESSGLPSLSKQIINGTNVAVPRLAEQRAIGSFFRDLDHLITLHQRKCDNAFQDGDRSADLLCCLQIVKNARRNRSKTYCFCCGNVRRNRRWCLFLCQRKPAFLLEGDAI